MVIQLTFVAIVVLFFVIVIVEVLLVILVKTIQQKEGGWDSNENGCPRAEKLVSMYFLLAIFVLLG